MTKSDRKKEYLSSLKSIETENLIDQAFYRPLGFKIARRLQHTGITPNAVTIISIFVGVSAGVMWYFPYHIGLAVMGVLALICANILDCVDGQLARLTGISSEIGRILDGFAGDLWFLTIYIAFAHRVAMQFSGNLFGMSVNPWWFAILVVLAGLSHLNQASLIDYYKTLHLYFISPERGKEFETSESVQQRYRAMSPGAIKVFTWGYHNYTVGQERATPQLQNLMAKLHDKYNGNDIPDELREELRDGSLRLMPMMDLLTFNGRSVVLFISVLFNIVWFYFFWEIVILNIIRYVLHRRHEAFCKEMTDKI